MSMENIEHIVVLMLENRSFDSMLGWLYEHETPEHFIPASTEPKYRGLKDIDPIRFINRALDGKLAIPPIRGASGFTAPNFAPGEDYEHVMLQFHGRTAPHDGEPTMTGVLDDYFWIVQNQMWLLDKANGKASELAPIVMQSYTPSQAPVLNQLARHYAVCDAWYASVPSQTNPNRAFLMCGTSDGLLNNGDLEIREAREVANNTGMVIGDDRFDKPTLFNALQDAGEDWAVFYQCGYLPKKMATLLKDPAALLGIVGPLAKNLKAFLDLWKPFVPYIETLASGDLESCYTWRLFPQIKDRIPDAAQNFQQIEDFHRRARAGTLPKFSYIEPAWSIAHNTNYTGKLADKFNALFSSLGNDFHPPGSILVGEQFVKEVYTSLIANEEAWKKTLLLITFDEFVGAFDHQTADLRPGVVKPPWRPGEAPPQRNRHKFDFDRLGARVPTIVVSPYVERGTVFRSDTDTPFDHASVIRTVLDAIGRPDLVEPFGQRAGHAPSFAAALALDQPRADARALGFLDAPRGIGDPVRLGESFVLKNQNGQYLAHAEVDMKFLAPGASTEKTRTMMLDLGLTAYFPVLGEGEHKALLSFVSPEPDPAATIAHGARLRLVTREHRVGSANMLGAWADSHDCYYDTEYMEGVYGRRQTWSPIKLDRKDQPLCYGDRIYLKNDYYPVRAWLAQDRRRGRGKWLTSNARGDVWTIEPALPRR